LEVRNDHERLVYIRRGQDDEKEEKKEMASTEEEIAGTWVRLEEGIDQVMNNLEQGMSYNKYMEWYT
jgi:hypothetical protein